MAKKNELRELEDVMKFEHKVFCKEYIFDWNATRSYKVAYPKSKDNAASVNGHKLLRNTNIEKYIELIQNDISKIAEISILMNIKELKKIAFSSLHKFKTNWMEMKEWNDVSEDDKAAVAEITTTTKTIPRKDGEPIEVVAVKFKLYDKLKAIAELNKMTGANAAIKQRFVDGEGNDVLPVIERVKIEIQKPHVRIKKKKK